MLMGRHGRPRVGRHQFTEETRRNALFEEYYKGQGIVPESEWPEFIRYLQQDLPITFRVTGFREQNKELLRLIKHRYREEISQITFPAGEQQPEKQTQQRIAFDPLPWYPDELAWQLDTNRFVVRKTQELKVLHQFLVSEMESGNISRQEAVSMLPPLVMDIRSHHAILDLCAAPGSKSAQLVELLHADAESRHPVTNRWSYAEPTGMVVANDVDQKRCYMMVHQVKRLQSPCTMITQEDATCFPKLYVPRSSTEQEPTTEVEQFLFDRILTDVPCSGDGTLRKNPDLWLRWSPNLGIAQHYLQLRILRRGLELLRDQTSDGYGRLVYSTCSFNPLENEAVVAQMLHACQGAVRLVDPDELPSVTRVKTKTGAKQFLIRPGLLTWRVMNKKGCWFDKFADVPQSQHSNLRPSLFPPENVSELHLERCMRILPHDQNTGGFFLAVFEKIAPLPWMKQARRPATAVDTPLVLETNDSEKPNSEQIDVSESSTVPEHSEVVSGKRPHESLLNTASEETKKPRIFNENPFTYIDPSADTEWHGIRDYYGMVEETNPNEFTPPVDRRFPASHLLYRSTKEELRRRQFYYTNGLIKRIIQSNSSRGLKIVSSGVRVFSIMEDKQFNGYRLLQDGVDLADAFLPPSGGRRIRLTDAEYPDLVLLLQEEMPLISRMTPVTQAQWSAIDPGPVLIEYSPASETDQESTDPNMPQCRLVFAGWRGVKSLRHYIGRHERLHLMRLANLEPKPAIMGHTPQVKENLTAEGDGPPTEESTNVNGESELIEQA